MSQIDIKFSNRLVLTNVMSNGYLEKAAVTKAYAAGNEVAPFGNFCNSLFFINSKMASWIAGFKASTTYADIPLYIPSTPPFSSNVFCITSLFLISCGALTIFISKVSNGIVIHR